MLDELGLDEGGPLDGADVGDVGCGVRAIVGVDGLEEGEIVGLSETVRTEREGVRDGVALSRGRVGDVGGGGVGAALVGPDVGGTV